MTDPAALAPSPTAVALLDALGFKEARKMHGAEALVAAVQIARERVKGEASVNELFGAAPIEVAALSDTLVVTRRAKESQGPGDREASAALSELAESVALVLASAVEKERKAALCYRGCISFGPLVAHDSVFVGEPIDDAAAWYNEASAAVVWLTPNASRKVLGDDLALVEWPVPLRGRGTILTRVVNPFWTLVNHSTRQPDLDAMADLQRRLLAPMLASTSVDVVQKHQNTAAFLEVARRNSLEIFDRMEPLGDEYTPEHDD